MKKKQIKYLNFLADQLPDMKELKLKGDNISGTILLERIASGETKAPKGIDINKKGRYSDRKYVFEDINHRQRIKRAYSKNGPQGVFDYLKYLSIHRKRINDMVDESKKIAKLPPMVKKLMSGGVGAFWSILAFFYSFVAVFSKKED